MNEEELQALALLVDGRYFDGKVLKVEKSTTEHQCNRCYLYPVRFDSADCHCPGRDLIWQPMSFPTTPQPKE